MSDTCQTCAYVRLNKRSGELECRIDPPRILVLKRATISIWPDVQPSDWCNAHMEAAS